MQRRKGNVIFYLAYDVFCDNDACIKPLSSVDNPVTYPFYLSDIFYNPRVGGNKCVCNQMEAVFVVGGLNGLFVKNLPFASIIRKQGARRS